MVHFSALPKNEPHSPFLCERSERVVNSYSLFIFVVSQHSVLDSPRTPLIHIAQKREKVVHFSSFPENEPPFLFFTSYYAIITSTVSIRL
ncbi:MAG: hypothetical protein U5L45_17665 [Saprospiraceae bacterium]|nr:hypothetical protein [Saprospiraceae bacterium]